MVQSPSASITAQQQQHDEWIGLVGIALPDNDAQASNTQFELPVERKIVLLLGTAKIIGVQVRILTKNKKKLHVKSVKYYKYNKNNYVMLCKIMK
jgi:hypothetical protein